MGLTVPATGSCGSGWGNRESSSGTFRGECLGRLRKVINLSISGGWESERWERRYSSCNAGCLSAFGLWALQDVGSLSLLVSNVGCRWLDNAEEQGRSLPNCSPSHPDCLQCKGTDIMKDNLLSLASELFLHVFKMWHSENMSLNHAGIFSAW